MDHRLNALLNGPSTNFYNVEVDSSSDEEAKSSDDDIDNLDEDKQENDSDSFEKEMEMELNKEFRKHREFHCHIRSKQENKETDAQENEANKKYDDEYFSSGSDEDQDNVGGVSSKSKERRAKMTDDELLYDPNMDDEDENWVKKQREGHQNQENDNTIGEISGDLKAQKKKSQKPRYIKSANSDAILSCPACLTTLCIDCQRHDTYKMQFRAMFVMNCNIKTDESLCYEAKNDKKKLGKKKQKEEQVASTSAEVPKNELFHPVQCALCNTEVAVYDKDEIYHFFNVVESLS